MSHLETLPCEYPAWVRQGVDSPLIFVFPSSAQVFFKKSEL
jgi:hypothetical protein